MRTSALGALVAPLATLVTQAVHAHDGHGLVGPHWHATDVFGFIALSVAVGVAVWFWRK